MILSLLKVHKYSQWSWPSPDKSCLQMKLCLQLLPVVLLVPPVQSPSKPVNWNEAFYWTGSLFKKKVKSVMMMKMTILKTRLSSLFRCRSRNTWLSFFLHPKYIYQRRWWEALEAAWEDGWWQGFTGKLPPQHQCFLCLSSFFFLPPDSYFVRQPRYLSRPTSLKREEEKGFCPVASLLALPIRAHYPQPEITFGEMSFSLESSPKVCRKKKRKRINLSF